MIPTDEIYYADNEGIMVTDYIEPHKVKCTHCHEVFFTQVPIVGIRHGMVKCKNCGCCKHNILDEPIPKPDFLAKTMNIPTTRNTSSDLYDSLLYAAQKINNMEDKNMKKAEKNIEKDKNVLITRRCDTSRGIFTVSQLEPTDMFALIDDEDQTVYMAIYEEDPKYKTKQAVVNMHNGNLLYLDLSTKIHVYREGCELRVGEFIWSSEGYN